ncbi:MAG TPA: glycosyltransferase [Caulobacteraceae bacterium]
MKIAVYAICLNEEKFAERFVASARGADLILVADTGSTDRTVAILEGLGVEVRHIRIKPWRFDDGRNAALALLPDDIDVCVSLDLDTVLSEGWRAALEAAWTPETNRAYYTEIWGRHPDGQPRRFLNNRIHARHGVRWKGPCHECVVPDRTEEKAVVVEGLTIEQFADPDKSRAQYLPLLELAAKEAPHEPRQAHYYGRELYFHNRYREAIAEFERYLALPNKPFVSERNGTLRLLAQCHEALGEGVQALRWFQAAVNEAPQLRGPWIDLAWAFYQRQAWQACWEAALRAIAIAPGSTEYGDESNSGVLPEDLACICGWRLGHRRQALEFGRRALALAPTVERLAANVAKMERELGETPGSAVLGQAVEAGI